MDYILINFIDAFESMMVMNGGSYFYEDDAWIRKIHIYKHEFLPIHHRIHLPDENIILKIYIHGFIEVAEEWLPNRESCFPLILDVGLFPLAREDIGEYDARGIDYSDWVDFKVKGTDILL